MPGHARRHSAVSCAKISELIDLPFGLWAGVGRRKHNFSPIHQVVNTIEPPMMQGCGLMSNGFDHLYNVISCQVCHLGLW